MKKTPFRSRSAPLRSREPARGGGIKRKTRIKTSNAKRRKSEFTRCYHSRERVEFVKGLGCWVCKHPLSDNAHLESDGMARKAGYDRIVALCREHHRAYDQRRPPFDLEFYRAWLAADAPRVEAAWQSHLRQTGHAREDTE